MLETVCDLDRDLEVDLLGEAEHERVVDLEAVLELGIRYSSPSNSGPPQYNLLAGVSPRGPRPWLHPGEGDDVILGLLLL